MLFITDSTGPETLIINMPNMWPGPENGSKGGENLDWAGGSIQEKKGINCEMAGKKAREKTEVLKNDNNIGTRCSTTPCSD